jgi:hypothetical protein
MITSSVQEDGYELSLTMTFALRDNKDPFVGRQLGISTHKGYLSQHTERDSVISDEEDEIGTCFRPLLDISVQPVIFHNRYNIIVYL